MRKGSALLIVLGMLSFMVVSAVSFSMFMRQSRLPSSYLRRNIAARHLVRAALARAIEELEGDFNDNRNWGKYELGESDVAQRFYGIYDDPYPGCGWKPSGNGGSSDNPELDGDFWCRRVFMPFGPTKYPECTVPTMTLEALAYLPPAIIDDVRVFSRYSRTASWRMLPYETGRYAYTAVNVSDLFDINRLRASEPRDSGLNRVTLATLCATSKDDPLDIDAGRASSLQTLVDKWSNQGGYTDTPFVSLADFNLLAGTGSGFAPFMKFVGKTTASLLDQSNADTANALFVTDTWFPAAMADKSGGGSSGGGGGSGAIGQNGGTIGLNTTPSGKVLDLASNAQPFLSFNAKTFPMILNDRNSDSDVKDIYEKNLGIGLACLYDYLDSDSKPVSLALPTTEAVPMITGISCPAMLQVELDSSSVKKEGHFYIDNKDQTDLADGGDPKIEIKRTCSQVRVTSFGSRVQAKVLLTYPFKRMAKTNRYNSNHKIRGLLRVFAAPAGMGCRVDDDLLWPNKSDHWKDGVAPRNGVATFLSDTKQITAFSSDVKTTDQAVDDSVILTFPCNNISMPVFWQVNESAVKAKYKAQYPDKDYRSLDGLPFNEATFRPLTVQGVVDGNWKQAASAAKRELDENADQGGVTEFGFAGEYRLYASVWLQVLEGSDVVDMVPASLKDDIEWLGVGNSAYSANARMTGDGTTLMNFCSNIEVKFADIPGSLGTGAPAQYPDWKTLYAVDPRFNFAPENWFGLNANTSVSKTEWMQSLGLDGSSSPLLGQNGRDRDIFMFVSDQEYLQDIGELQFLPVLANFDGSATFLNSYSPTFTGTSFSQRTGPTTGDFANGNQFWRTYTAYDNGNGYDPIYALPPNDVRVHSGVGTFKLNPYSDDNRVLAGALGLTPFDYYVASTNSNQTQSGGRPNTLGGNLNINNMASTYAFGESDVAKLDADDMLDMMDEIKATFQNCARNGDRNWADAWNSLAWQTRTTDKINDKNDFFLTGQKLKEADACPLHGVDRKFLYSFWHECFDNRQQLFLIFVRAEPSASCGAIGKELPSSQLGGRAVALVWRDPAVPTYKAGQRKPRSQLSNKETCMDNREMCPPHRTRVLFYHQFD